MAREFTRTQSHPDGGSRWSKSSVKDLADMAVSKFRANYEDMRYA